MSFTLENLDQARIVIDDLAEQLADAKKQLKVTKRDIELYDIEFTKKSELFSDMHGMWRKKFEEEEKAQKVLDELKLHAVDWMGNTSGKLCVSLIEQLEVKVQK